MLARPVESFPVGGRERREYELVRSGEAPLQLWYEVDEAHADLLSPTMDHLAVACIMLAMRDRATLVLEGQVSGGLIANLGRYQEVWATWRPERYARVDVIADATTSATTDAPGSVMLFSGGVDATWMLHSLHRHQGLVPGRTTAVMVAGMGGFQPGREDLFDTAFTELSADLAAVGVELIRVGTNWEQVMLPLGLPIMETYATGFVSCLHAIAPDGATGFVASGHGPRPDAKISGSPEIDPLLSSERLRMIHYGAGVSRSQKLADLHRWGIDTAHVRVCNRTLRPGRNCGVCEKCVRTSIASMVACTPLPGGLRPPTVGLVRGIDVHEPVIRDQWLQLFDEMDEHSCIPTSVRRAAERRIWWYERHLPTRHGTRRLVTTVARLTRAVLRRLRRG